MKIFICVVIACSVLLNLLVLKLDIIPFLKRFFYNRRKLNNENSRPVMYDTQKTELNIVHSAESMIKSGITPTVWREHRGISEIIFNSIIDWQHNRTKKYHYPTAYLYYGLSTYHMYSKDKRGQLLVKKYFDDLITKEGMPNFKFDKVDQVPFGLTAINLYKVFKEPKYKYFYEYVYSFLKKIKKEDGVIYYSQAASSYIQYYDVLGMVLPFLVEYYKVSSEMESINIARTQIEFYIKYGVDKETYFPAHGIDTRYNIKVGSCNWGRGIGWYLLGLSYYNEVTGEFFKELNTLQITLNKLELSDCLFSQFPGCSSKFDASSTTMILNSFKKSKFKCISKTQVLNLLSNYIDSNGLINNTSGDTTNSNLYSRSFGYSGLSQGMLLLLLCEK